jgi:hypothetical protein
MARFELTRGDLSRATLNAAEFARLAARANLLMWVAFRVFLEGLADARIGSAGGGLAIAVSKQQTTRSFELRAHYGSPSSTNRPVAAPKPPPSSRPCSKALPSTPEMPEIVDAHAMLKALDRALVAERRPTEN